MYSEFLKACLVLHNLVSRISKVPFQQPKDRNLEPVEVLEGLKVLHL